MHHDSLKNLALGYFERLFLHVRVVHGYGLQIRQEVKRFRKKKEDEKALYAFSSLGKILGITVREGRKLLEDLQLTIDAQGWKSSVRWKRDGDLEPIHGRMLALRQDLCVECQGKDPLILHPSGGWQDRALWLLTEAWYHGQRGQQYMEFLRRKLNENQWAGEDGFEDVRRSVHSTLSLLMQEFECLTGAFNAYTFFVEDRTVTTDEYRPRCCVPALELASEYVLEPELCPTCRSVIAPPPPFPIY